MDLGQYGDIVIVIGTVAGLFLWLRKDIQVVRDEMNSGFSDMDERLRTVEKEAGQDGRVC